MMLGVMAGGSALGGFGMKLAVMGASIIGSLLLNGKKKPVGKLNDLRVSSASYGRGIPIVYSTMRVTGNLFWMTDFEETMFYMTQKGKRKPAGDKIGEKKAKKGKAQEMYEYHANFAMGLCEGPIDTVLRIWADNNLIYDKLNPNNEDIVEIGFTRQDADGDGKRAAKSPARKKGHQGDSGRFQFRFYNGHEEQMPDPFMVKQQGAGNVPGFRGLCYLFFERFALNDFGNRIPTITAEVSMKLERRPFIQTIANLSPPDSGWEHKVLGPAVFDSVRARLYHRARDNNGVDYLRVYSLADMSEVRRISITSGHQAGFPQVGTFKDYLKDDDLNAFVNHPYEVTGVGSWVGIACNGDLIFRAPGVYNYMPVFFIDPDSFVIKRIFGNRGIMGGAPSAYIGAAQSAFQIVGEGSFGTPTPLTAIVDVWSNVYLFDHNNDYQGFIASEGLSHQIKRVSPGLPYTKNGIFALEANTYNLTGRVWRARARGATLMDIIEDDGEKKTVLRQGHSELRLFYQWPPEEEAALDTGSTFVSDIKWGGLVAGSNAFGGIASITNHSTIENGVWAIKVDATSGEEVWRAKVTSTVTAGPSEGFQMPNHSSGHTVSWLWAGTLFTVDFTAEKVSSFYVGNLMPEETYGEFYYSNLDAILYWSNAVDDGKWVIGHIDRRVQTKTAVSDIVLDIALRCGIPRERINISGMAPIDEEITGYMIENPTEGRTVIEELAQVFQFDAVESDHMLHFRSRGGSSVVTIPQDDLGVVDTDFGTENEYFAETRFQEIDLPDRCNVGFLDPGEKYEQGLQFFKRPTMPVPVSNTRQTLEVTLPMALSPSQAKTLAQRILYAAWGERTSHQYVLPQEYLWLDPTDVITVEFDNGERFIDRITDIEVGADNSLALTTIAQVASSYTLTTTAGERGGVIRIIRPPDPFARPAVFDVPYLSDDDVDDSSQFVYYWAAVANADGFRFGSLLSKKPGRDETEGEGVTQIDAIWGFAVGIVPPPPHGCEVTDETTRIHLIPAFNFNGEDVVYTWESVDPEDWPTLNNMLIIGDEVILFRDVEEHDDGSVTISHLIRGYRGTGNAAYTHQGGEDWVLALPSSTRTAEEPISSMGVEQAFFLSSMSAIPYALTEERKRLTAASRKPWQVGALSRVNNTGPGSITVSWKRATRYNGELKNGTASIPLNEEYMQFEIFLLKQPYDPATWDPEDSSLYHYTDDEVATEAYTFSPSVLAAAGLTLTSDIHVVIYQKSALVGRGFPRGATLNYTLFPL